MENSTAPNTPIIPSKINTVLIFCGHISLSFGVFFEIILFNSYIIIVKTLDNVNTFLYNFIKIFQIFYNYPVRRQIMNGFKRRKEQKKENIRRATMELFKVYGFKKVSISDIANKAGVSQVTIYNHFGSKEELVREVVRTQLLDIMGKYREMIKEEKPFPEKMEAIIFDKTGIVNQYHGEFTRTAISGDPELQQFMESFWRGKVVQMTVDLLEEGKRQGYVNPELSHEALLLYLEILRRGVLASSDTLAKIEPKVELFRELNFLIIYGLVGKKE
jgi:AcrR family transcriptional regulator